MAESPKKPCPLGRSHRCCPKAVRWRYRSLFVRAEPHRPLADDAVEELADGHANETHRILDRAIDGDRNVPAAVRKLVDAASVFPIWVDEQRMNRAGELLFRTGAPGGIALGAKSLLSAYCSPGGNKPLIWSGRLVQGVSRRLAETAKFVSAVAEPGGLLPGAEGFRITMRVRLIHAQVRRLIRLKGGWRATGGVNRSTSTICWAPSYCSLPRGSRGLKHSASS